jgi:hypothetical protein
MKKGGDGKWYVQSHPETFALILTQIRRGSIILTGLMRTDMSKFKVPEATLPIRIFIDKYRTYSGYFKSVNPALPADAAAAILQNNESIQTIITEMDKKGPPTDYTQKGYKGGAVNALRTFLFELMDAYVHQYNITDATTIEDKLNNVYGDFEESFNIEIKKPGPDYTTIQTNLFSILDITEESITDYCTEESPKTVPILYGESREGTAYIGTPPKKGAFSKGGGDDEGSDEEGVETEENVSGEEYEE